MSRQIDISDTLTLYPSSVDTDKSQYASISNQSSGYDDSSSTNYATINLTTGSQANTYVYWKFDTSEIPEGATINSISCSAKAYVSSTNTRYINTRQMQLTTGTTTKGSAATISNSASTQNLTVGSWTAAEVRDIYLRIYVKRGTSSTSSSNYYARFYGATLTVSYSLQGTAYTITATSSVAGTTIEPATQELLEGESATVKIYTDDLDILSVTDNGTDIKDQLVQKEIPSGDALSKAPESYTTTGTISGTRYQSTVGHTVENPSGQSGNDYASGSGNEVTIYYHFDFSEIPDEAVIDYMRVRAYGHLESTSSSSEVAELNVYYGTTAKGTTVSYESTSNATLTIPHGNWTVAELKSDARVGFTIGYYGGLTSGITWEVTYSIPGGGGVYYEYTLENLSADHVISVEEEGIVIPPDEDPQYTYYSITTSSINATTNPGTGTVRVQEGSNQVITITPSDPKLTLALDNGVDISDQLEGGAGCTYTITTPYTYGFEINGSDYYESNNQGQSSSAAVARVNLDLTCECMVTFTYINQGEAGYDYGMFSNIDTQLNSTGNTASSGVDGSTPGDSTSSYKYICNSAADSTTTVKTLTYQVSSGQHTIDVKYAKDQASDDGNDSLQFKVSLEPLEGNDYTYTLNNINAKHSLIFVFGDVNYYFINTSGTECRLYPDGQSVKLEGQNFHLIIVPDEPTAEVSITDNNVDRTSSLVREEGVDKQGNTVVNYTYTLDNIVAAHTITVECETGAAKIYIKNNGVWTRYRKIYLKVNGTWVEQVDNWDTLFDTNTDYVRKS